jgi:hypothetical protein
VTGCRVCRPGKKRKFNGFVGALPATNPFCFGTHLLNVDKNVRIQDTNSLEVVFSDA